VSSRTIGMTIHLKESGVPRPGQKTDQGAARKKEEGGNPSKGEKEVVPPILRKFLATRKADGRLEEQGE